MKKKCTVFFNRDKRKVGFCVENFEELIRRSCKTFQLRKNDVKLVLDDGTEVDDDDYFQYLTNNTLLTLQLKYDTSFSFWSKTKNWICKIWSMPQPSKDLQSIMNGLLSSPESRKELQDMLDKADMNLKDSKRDDPDWFEGLPINVNSKVEWMYQNSKNRIRGYYTRTKDEVEKLIHRKKSGISSSDGVVFSSFENLFLNLSKELRENQFHAGYFGRDDSKIALCNSEGWFKCQGSYKTTSCQSNHKINPYGNRESRILFSTWNLDHVIERSRSVIPAIVEAILDSRNKTINWVYFYNLLFVAKFDMKTDFHGPNLKLVHIVCHVKASHKECTCDKNFYFV